MAWRDLPRAGRVTLLAVAAIAVVVLLFTVVFPRVERYLENPTLGAPDTPTSAGRG